MASHSGQSWACWRLILGSLGRDSVSFWIALGATASYSGQSWARSRLILGSRGCDGVLFCAVLGAMASESGQSRARWRLILESLGRDGVAFRENFRVMASHCLGRDAVSFWTVLSAMTSGQSWVLGAMASHFGQSSAR